MIDNLEDIYNALASSFPKVKQVIIHNQKQDDKHIFDISDLEDYAEKEGIYQLLKNGFPSLIDKGIQIYKN